MSGNSHGSKVVPGLRYDDAPMAIEWLCDVLGFTRHMVVPGEAGTIAHAQLTYGSGMIMLGSTRDDEVGRQYATPKRVGSNTQSAYIVVDEIDAHYAQATAAGAEVLMELEEQGYGGKAYSVRDPEGHIWHVGSYDPWADHG